MTGLGGPCNIEKSPLFKILETKANSPGIENHLIVDMKKMSSLSQILNERINTGFMNPSQLQDIAKSKTQRYPKLGILPLNIICEIKFWD